MVRYALAALLALSAAACSSNYRAHDTERNRTVTNDRRDFEHRVQARLDKIEREIKEWQDRKADAKTDRAKRASDRRIDDLEQLKAETRQKFNELKGDNNENWEKFKSDFSAAMDNLEAKWNEFKDDVKAKT
jgi:hypothetical protein